MKRTILLAICTLTVGIAPAMAETFDFSQPLTLGPTTAPGVWYTDRYAPSGFASQATAPDGTINTLQETINAADWQGPDSFYDTQGRAYNLVPGDNSVTISLYVDAAWANDNEREAGFWATGVDGNGNLTTDYPIIEFQGAITSGSYANGGVAGFYGWDNVNNAWDLITATNFTYGSWATLTMTLEGNEIDYSVDGTSELSGEGGADASLSNVILEGYNGPDYLAPQNYSAYWNDLSAAQAPEPGTVATMFVGMGLLGLGMRFRRKA